MRKAFQTWLTFVVFLYAGLAVAQESNTVFQDAGAIEQAARSFLTTQLQNKYKKIDIEIKKLDARAKYAQCAQLEAFLPAGAKLIGKTTVGVRCLSPKAWVVFLPTNVHAIAHYLVAATTLDAGLTIQSMHVIETEGDISQQPATLFTDATQVVGQTLNISVPAGTPLRKEQFRIAPGIRQGQAVHVVITGTGFQVATEGRATQNSAIGDNVAVKLNNGQTVTGVAKQGGVVEITN